MARRVGDPASDEVMRMQVAPLTNAQLDLIRGYESQPTQPTYPVNTPAAPNPYAGQREKYDVQFPPFIEERRQRALDRAQQRRGVVKPDSPDLAANSGRRGFYQSGGYDPSAEAKVDNTGLDFNLPTMIPDAWDWRAKIRGGMEGSSYGSNPNQDIFIPQGAGGRPGEQVVHDYGGGTGYGTTAVMATADKSGRFNSFSDAPGARVSPAVGGGGPGSDPYGINAEIRATQQRIAGYRAGSGIMNRYFAGAATRNLKQQQQLGVLGGQLQLAQSRYGPDIALANARNRQLQTGGLSALQDFVAASGGHHNLLTIPGTGVTYIKRPGDIPEGGLAVKTFPDASGNYQQPQLPAMPTARTNMSLSPYDPDNPWR